MPLTPAEKRERHRLEEIKSRARNPKQAYVRTKKWREKPGNKKKVNAMNRASYRRNKETRLAKSKEWIKNNPDKVTEFNSRHRARLNNATTNDCSKKIDILRHEPFCHWCCVKLTKSRWRKFLPTDRSIDHIIPLTKGGQHCPDNLVASCRECNCKKHNRLISDWIWESK